MIDSSLCEYMMSGKENKLHYCDYPEKTVDTLSCYWWFLREMTSEKRVQKFHPDVLPLPRSGRTSDWLEICFIQSEALPRSGL